MLAAQRKTPGVYVTELSAFPPSVVGVQTAIPAFVGYTQRATQNGRAVSMKPVLINSLPDFVEVFGGDYPAHFDLKVPDATHPADITIGGVAYAVVESATPEFYLYNSLRLFYANGGGTCYIVSVGDYSKPVDTADLVNGLTVIKDQVGPTMLVVPDALLAATVDDFDKVTQAMLAQCGELRDRVAIFDVFGADTLDPGKLSEMTRLVDEFRSKSVGTENLNYGMTYFPCLHASVVETSDVHFWNFDVATLKTALTAEAGVVYGGGSDKAKAVAAKVTALVAPAADADPSAALAANQDMVAALPVLKQLCAIAARKLNVLPASGAMAGVFTYVDGTRGVWNAPANISLSSVVGPTFKITSKIQEDLNVPIEGKAVNAIRDFVGRGTLVWGARTLDGNSNDYRYIQVRRTLIYIEQSIKAALNQFVFAPNDGQTWVTVTSMISNFLQGLWSQGGLMGAKASEAFSVQCGLGSTMTGLDVLQGYMRVQVTLQMIHPAEFIELTFKQQMQGVG